MERERRLAESILGDSRSVAKIIFTFFQEGK